MFNYSEIKLAIYGLETVLGILMVIAAFVVLDQAQVAPTPITYVVPGVILLCMGSICMLFGVETYILREDPDIWR